MGTKANGSLFHILILLAMLSLLLIPLGKGALAVTPPDDVDYGLGYDEQQGGGGLVGQTVRILNGNALEYRTDLSFPSPNRLGLTFQVFYNSRSTRAGSLGYGWSHTYEAFLDPSVEIEEKTYLKIIDPTGRAAYFQEGDEKYDGAFHERSHVKEEPPNYVSGTGWMGPSTGF